MPRSCFYGDGRDFLARVGDNALRSCPRSIYFYVAWLKCMMMRLVGSSWNHFTVGLQVQDVGAVVVDVLQYSSYTPIKNVVDGRNRLSSGLHEGGY